MIINPYMVTSPPNPLTIAYDADNIQISGINGDVPDDWNLEFGEDIHYVTIGTSAEVIGTNAFNGEATLSGELNIPSSVNNIKSFAFRNARFTGIVMEEGVTGIGNDAFRRTSSSVNNLKNLVIPNSVKQLGTNAFNLVDAPGNGLDLETFQLGTGITGFGGYSFYRNFWGGWTGELDLSSAVDIGDYAFSYWGRVTGLTLSNNLKTLGNSAFAGMTNLKNVVIPSSVTGIGSQLFNQGLGSTQDPGGDHGPATIEINVDTGVWVGSGNFNNTNSGIYTITGAYFQDYTGSSWSVDQGVAAGSIFISGTY